MHHRRFGRLGWSVSEVGYGMWGLAGWTGSDDDETRASLREAVRLGCTFFDTAWGYGRGHSERLLGELLRETAAADLPGSGPLYTASKIPPKNLTWPSRRGFTLDDCFPPDHIREYAEKTLENLGTDRVDLLQFHVWEDAWARDERWQATMTDLKREGLIGGIGVSVNRWEPWNVLETLRTGVVDAVQVIYNIFDQAPEDELFPLCRELDIAVIARVPFDEGTLTGALTKESTWPEGDWRRLYFVPENLGPSVDRAEALKELVPPGMILPELALRFILSEATVSTVIPGMRRLSHVRANLAASDAGPLPTPLLDALRAHRWDREPTAWSY
ncbi:MAG TPA: aldo/keto reductase [Gemmatimonadaceae bacterium]|nr:aldo/keto reductase [Gemmatimonadaceae bacterium]